MTLIKHLQDYSQQFAPVAWATKSRRLQLADGLDLSVDERLTLALSMIVMRNHKSFIFEHPHPSPRLAMSAAIGVLLADFAERHTGSTSIIKNDLLLITRQVGLAITELQEVRLDWNLDVNDIWEVKNSNQISGKRAGNRPFLIVAPPRPPSMSIASQIIDAVIIDASHPLTLERLELILSDPCIAEAPIKIITLPLGYRMQADYLKKWGAWCWYHSHLGNHASSSVTSSPLVNPQQTENQFWKRETLVCYDEPLEQILAGAKEKLVNLSKYLNSIPHELKQAWAIYQRLTSLPIKLGMYEDAALQHFHAQTLRQRLEQFRIVDIPSVLTNSSKTVWLSQWHPLVDQLKQAYDYLKGDEPTKFWAIAFIVEEHIQQNFTKPLVIACNTQIEANILIRELSRVCTHLHSFLHPNGLTITTVKNIASRLTPPNYDLLLTSPFSSRWRYLDISYQSLKIVVYPHEIPVVEYTIRDCTSYLEANIGHSNQASTLTALGMQLKESSSITSPIKFTYHIDSIDIEGTPSRNSKTQKTDPGNQIFIPMWAWDAEDITFVPPLFINKHLVNSNVNLSTNPITGSKVQITLKSGDLIQVPEGYMFDVYRKVTDELDSQSAETLIKGDIIILLDGENLTQLFDRIVEALESHSRFALLGVWLNLWELTKQSALEKCSNNYTELHKRLQRHGFDITEQAVRTWYKGIIAPREENIIFELINISGSDAAKNHKDELRAALGHVRGMRRALGRRIRHLVKTVAISSDTAILTKDKELNLAIEDVMAVAYPAEIVSVKVVA